MSAPLERQRWTWLVPPKISELRPTSLARIHMASAALAIVGGGRVAELQNANGVVLKVKGPEVGLEASLSLSGMTIAVISNSLS